MTARFRLIPALGLAALVGASAPLAAQGADSPVAPGYWEYKVSVLGIPASSEKRCVTPSEMDRFFPEICTRRFTCKYPVKRVGNGRIALKGVWIDKKQREAPVEASGTYARERFDLDVNMKTIHGLPLAGKLAAKRLGECPEAAA